jgi:hypothetical protein
MFRRTGLDKLRARSIELSREGSKGTVRIDPHTNRENRDWETGDSPRVSLVPKNDLASQFGSENSENSENSGELGTDESVPNFLRGGFQQDGHAADVLRHRGVR